MNNCRVFLSISLFIISTYLIFDLFLYGFDWLLLVICLLGFAFAHLLWPPKHDDESAWYDAIEVVIELPVRTFAVCIRGFGKVFKNVDSGIDL